MSGLLLTKGAVVNVTNSTITGNGDYGNVSVTSSNNTFSLTLSNSTVSSEAYSSYGGITLAGPTSGAAQNLYIYGSSITNNAGDGIQLSGNINLVMTGTTVSGNGSGSYSGIDVKSGTYTSASYSISGASKIQSNYNGILFAQTSGGGATFSISGSDINSNSAYAIDNSASPYITIGADSDYWNSTGCPPTSGANDISATGVSATNCKTTAYGPLDWRTGGTLTPTGTSMPASAQAVLPGDVTRLRASRRARCQASGSRITRG